MSRNSGNRGSGNRGRREKPRWHVHGQWQIIDTREVSVGKLLMSKTLTTYMCGIPGCHKTKMRIK